MAPTRESNGILCMNVFVSMCYGVHQKKADNLWVVHLLPVSDWLVQGPFDASNTSDQDLLKSFDDFLACVRIPLTGPWIRHIEED